MCPPEKVSLQYIHALQLIWNVYCHSWTTDCLLFAIESFSCTSPPGAALDDGQWHSVSLSAKRNHLSVVVDGHVTPASHWLGSEQVNSGGIFYFGGEKRSPVIWSIRPLCSQFCVLGMVSHMLWSVLTLLTQDYFLTLFKHGTIEWIKMTNYDLKWIPIRQTSLCLWFL